MSPSPRHCGRDLLVLTGALSVTLCLAWSAAAADGVPVGADRPVLSGTSGTVPASAVSAPASGLLPLAPPGPAVATAGIQAGTAAVARLLETQRATGLTCETSSVGTPLCVHGEDAPPPAHAAGTSGSGDSSGGRLGCYGDGTSGPRVRAVYARPTGSPDRYAAARPDFQRWAAAVSGQFDQSAAATGGRRHVRFATSGGPSCSLAVTRVELPTSAFDSFTATVDALQDKGLSAPHSKYLVWADASLLCGLATMFVDDEPGPDNLNNGASPGYARVDLPCWGKVEAHEVVHLLGGVQPAAPHSTSGFHCNDGHDLMCYADGTERSAQTTVCPAERARLLDCRNDDYFSTSPTPGSYLDKHWNTARSAFLAAELTQAAPPTAPPASSSPSPSPSASPRPTGSPLSERPALPALRTVEPPTPSTPPVPVAAVTTPLQVSYAVPALTGLGR